MNPENLGGNIPERGVYKKTQDYYGLGFIPRLINLLMILLSDSVDYNMSCNEGQGERCSGRVETFAVCGQIC